jgi:hypothetical protein
VSRVSFRCPGVPSDLYIEASLITAGRDTLKDILPKTAYGHRFMASWLAAFWCKAAYSMPAVFKSVP